MDKRAPQATRARANIRHFRREQLIEATMRTIAKQGYARTTMGQVAKEAGLSQGIVNFYFKTKESLLYETLVTLSEEYEALSRQAIERAAGDPVAALNALIETDVGPQACSPQKVAVWLAFWAESRGRPKYRQLCANLIGGYFRQVGDLCTQIATRGGYENVDVEVVSRGLNSMIDGLWVDLVIDPKSFDRQRSRDACLAYLASFFPAEFAPYLGGTTAERQRGAG